MDPRTPWRLFVVGALVTPVVFGAVVDAHPGSTSWLIDVDHTGLVADTYMFSIRVDKSFNIVGPSHFEVSAAYGLNNTQQDAAAVVGVVRFIEGISCVTAAGDDPCFMALSGASLKDSGDVQVAVNDPTTVTFERDTDRLAWGGVTTRVEWTGTNGFQKAHPSDSHVTFRFFVSVPGAQRLDVDIHIHAEGPSPVAMNDEVWHKGGFRYVGDELEPTARADTMAANAMVQGEATYDFQPATPPQRLYAIFGPTTVGVSVINAGTTVALTHNTATAADYGIDLANGNTRYGTYLAFQGLAGYPFVAGEDTPGDYRFFANWEASAGPSEMMAVGFDGEIAG